MGKYRVALNWNNLMGRITCCLDLCNAAVQEMLEVEADSKHDAEEIICDRVSVYLSDVVYGEVWNSLPAAKLMREEAGAGE